MAESKPIHPSTSSGPHVLYMEDDPGLARLIQKRLERAGYVVDLACDGKEGLDMYAAGSYDVVAVDQNMPVHNGLEVIRILASRGSLPPTIMVTSGGDEKIAVEAMKLGARDYIVKDVERGFLDLLPTVIEQVFQQQKRATHLAVVNQVARQAASILDLDQLLQEVVTAIQQSFNYYHVGLFLMDEAAGEIEMQAIAGGFADIAPAGHRLALGEGMVGWTAETGQPLLANDVSQEPRYVLGILKEALTQAELCVPLKLADKVIGVLDIQSTQLNAFDETDLMAMETLADQLTVAIENARLYQETARRLKETETLGAVATTLTRSLDLDQVLQAILDSAVATISAASAGTIHLTDESRGRLMPKAASHRQFAVAEVGGMARGQGGAGLAWDEKRIIHIADVSSDPRFITTDMGTSFRSLLVAPFLMGDRCLGTISLHSDETNAFTFEDERLLSTLASQAAIAIENAQLFEETKRRLEEMTALYQTSLDITTLLVMPELLQSIVKRAVTLLRAEAGGIFLYDPEREELRWVADYGYTGERVGITLKPREGMTGKVFQTGEPLVVDDYQTWEGKASVYEADQPFTAVLEVPLKWRGQIIGVLAIADVQKRTFNQDDVWLATLFANQAAVAIENARLYEKITERMREATLLHRVSSTLMRTLNLERLLENILEVLQKAFGYSNCAILLPDEEAGELRIKAARGYLQTIIDGLRIKIGQEGITGWVAANKMPLNVPEVTKDDRYVEGVEGIRSELAVPMLAGERVVGILDVQSTEVNAFGEDDLRTLSSVAAQATIAIERARFFQEARRRSREQAILFRASAAVLSTLQIGEVLYEVAEQMTLAIDATSARVCQWNEAGGTVTVIAEYVTPHAPQKEQVSHLGTVYPVKNSTTFQVLRDRQPLTISLADPEISDKVRTHLEEFGGNTVLYLPLAVRERVIGYVEVWESRRKRHFTPEEINLCQAISNQAAIAIENARLFAAEESSRQKMEAVIQKMTDGLLIIDAHCDIILANQRAAELLAVATDDMVSQNLLTMCPYPTLNALVREALDQSPHITTGEISIEESGRYDLGVTIALFIQDGEQVLWYVLLHDITHLKEVDRMKSDFVSNVSHDLRTPLANIKLYAALAQKGRPEKRQHYLTIIESETERLEALIEDILDLSRLERGAVKLQMEPLSLTEIFQQVVGAHLATAQDKGVDLAWQVPADLPTLRADRNQLLLMLNNLLGNALQYTPRGGSVWVEARVDEWQGKPALHIAVCDTGIGIPADERERIFERFYRGRHTPANTTGTGLGLAIVKESMALHGGEVMVESTVGEGSTLTLCFPLERK